MLAFNLLMVLVAMILDRYTERKNIDLDKEPEKENMFKFLEAFLNLSRADMLMKVRFTIIDVFHASSLLRFMLESAFDIVFSALL